MALSPILYFSFLLWAAPIVAQNMAADLSVAATDDQLFCLQASRYSVVLVRTFKPDGKNGTVDAVGVQTLQTIIQNKKFGMRLETGIYMEPKAKGQHGGKQLDEMYTALSNAGIFFRRLWIKVTASDHWHADPSANVAFINSLIQRAKQYGLLIGMFTSKADWQAITGNVLTLSSAYVDLWYTNVYWPGTTGETTPDFTDFEPFGPFNTTSVLMKQYGVSEPVCNLILNNNVFFS